MLLVVYHDKYDGLDVIGYKKGKDTHDTKAQMAVACTQTLFYFSFRHFRKHRRASLPLPLLPCAAGQ